MKNTLTIGRVQKTSGDNRVNIQVLTEHHVFAVEATFDGFGRATMGEPVECELTRFEILPTIKMAVKRKMLVHLHGETKGNALYLAAVEAQNKSLADKLDRIATTFLPTLNEIRAKELAEILLPT